MGSVGENYRCPLCGVVGMGGYHVDGLLLPPICTEGKWNCLDRTLEHPWTSVGQFLYTNLRRHHPTAPWLQLPADVQDRVAEFMTGQI